MPIHHAIVHLIEKKPDGTPAVLHARDAELGDSQAIENLLADLNESYNAKNKAWGFFQGESGAYPFSGWLGEYLEGDRDFVGFSREAVEHLQKLMEESNLSTGGHILFAHYQQGMTDYLAIALLHHSEGVAVNESLEVTRRATWTSASCTWPRGSISPNGATTSSRSSTSRSSRARAGRRSPTISATSSAARKGWIRRARRAPC